MPGVVLGVPETVLFIIFLSLSLKLQTPPALLLLVAMIGSAAEGRRPEDLSAAYVDFLGKPRPEEADVWQARLCRLS